METQSMKSTEMPLIGEKRSKAIDLGPNATRRRKLVLTRLEEQLKAGTKWENKGNVATDYKSDLSDGDKKRITKEIATLKTRTTGR